MKTGDTDLIQALDSRQVLGVLTGSALIAVDSNALISAVTPEAEALLGLKVDNLIGQNLSALPSALQKALAHAGSSGTTPGDSSFELQIPGRGRIKLLLMVVPLSGSNGETGGYIALVHDAAARKQVEQHLRRLNTLSSIGTLSASMAHEVKNALVASKTFIELLLEKHPDDELCDIVRRETARIDGLLGQMLRFSAPGKGGFTAISLHEALDHSLRLITPKLHSKSVALDRQFAAPEDVIEGDSYQLQQAFVNLFLNSMDATPSQGTVSVYTEAAPLSDPLRQKLGFEANGSYVKVTIADTGEGIPSENIPHIFEPFFTTKRSGTGLGLPITRGIVEEHGGAIGVDSKPEDGTRFTLILPLLKSQQRAD